MQYKKAYIQNIFLAGLLFTLTFLVYAEVSYQPNVTYTIGDGFGEKTVEKVQGINTFKATQKLYLFAGHTIGSCPGLPANQDSLSPISCGGDSRCDRVTAGSYIVPSDCYDGCMSVDGSGSCMGGYYDCSYYRYTCTYSDLVPGHRSLLDGQLFQGGSFGYSKNQECGGGSVPNNYEVYSQDTQAYLWDEVNPICVRNSNPVLASGDFISDTELATLVQTTSDSTLMYTSGDMSGQVYTGAWTNADVKATFHCSDMDSGCKDDSVSFTTPALYNLQTSYAPNGGVMLDKVDNQAAQLSCTVVVTKPNYTYSSWGACSVTACGQTGVQSRTESCSSAGGCIGKQATTQSCSTAPCNSCVPDGSCNATTPACNTTTIGVDNCGGTCTKVGGICAQVDPGVCNPSFNNQQFQSAAYNWSDFISNACASGTAIRGSGWAPSSGPWTWSCKGSDGSVTNCSASLPGTPPSCNGATTGSQADNPLTRSPYPTLCSVGTPANGNTNGNTSSWTCDKDGQSISCNANWTVSSVGDYSYGGWSSCSKSCGGGIQTRSESCNYNSCGNRQSTTQSCNVNSCATPVCNSSWGCSDLIGAGKEIDGSDSGYWSYEWVPRQCIPDTGECSGGEYRGYLSRFGSSPIRSATKVCETLGKSYASYETETKQTNCGWNYGLTYYRDDIGGWKTDEAPICWLYDASQQPYRGSVTVISSIMCQ